MTTPALQAFMELKGIQANYIDAWGAESTVSEENIQKLISKMGFNADNEAQLSAHYQQLEKDHWLSVLAPVCVFQHATQYSLAVHLPIDYVTEPLIYRVTCETGECIEKSLIANDFSLLAVQEVSDIEFQLYEVELALDVAIGYHQLTLLEPENDQPLAQMSLIITPTRCYIPEAIKQGKKLWGTTVQLYGVKSAYNWGVGDFSDLKVLLQGIAENGGDFVGLNPIHALSPAQPSNASPYSPSSRSWLNLIYIDITEIEELQHCQDLAEQLASPSFQAQLQSLRDAQWVDYPTITTLKLKALRDLFKCLHSGKKAQQKRLKSFLSYVEEKGQTLKQQAAYDALQFKFLADNADAWGWPVWPESFQAYDSEKTQDWCKENQQEVLFWCYCQWIAEQQLAQAEQLAESLGMELGIYRDLAVGVAKGSSEVWANPDLYYKDISIGAPPDVLGPLGQSWGLPPLSPDKLYQTGYQAFIELLRANMRFCGALRIDHVMALLRLWWVPEGETADKGAYVYYNVYDLLNILALESVRNRCLVVGEDLGTVPDGMEELLKEAGVYSYKVFFFEQAEDGGFISPSHYKQQALATLTTHDMATVKGYWHCDDLYLGRELGLYPDPEVFQRLLNDRVRCKQRILDSVHGHGLLAEDFARDANSTGMDECLNFTLQKHLAAGSHALLSLQLEDFLQMEKPVNVPGTSSEYPNWQRKLSNDLGYLFSNQNICRLLKAITHARITSTPV